MALAIAMFILGLAVGAQSWGLAGVMLVITALVVLEDRPIHGRR